MRGWTSRDAPVIIDKSGNILATISKEYYADESGFDPNMMVKIKPGGPFHGEDLYGLCDENGNVVVPCEYPYLQYCENGWYVAQNQDGRYGYIDKSGNVMIDFEFEDAEKFSCGLAPVLIDGLWGFINEDGEVVIGAGLPYSQCCHHKRRPIHWQLHLLGRRRQGAGRRSMVHS